METVDRVARLATFVANQIPGGIVLGMGSGSTAEAIVRSLGQRLGSDQGFTVTGVSTSRNTANLADSVGIPMRDLSDVPAIDLGFDGADEIDPDLNLVKGKGGALLYEKLVAEICADYWVVSTDEKFVTRLGTRLPLPVEVIPYGWTHTKARLHSLGLAPVLRKVGDDPCRTDAGNVILDCTPAPGVNLLDLADSIKLTTGVVEHGIFPSIARRAILVNAQGEIRTITPR